MEWNPQKATLNRIFSFNRKIAFKAFRSSSSSYISRKDVRKYIFSLNNGICHICNLNQANQIDHVKSVYSCFNGNLIFECNIIDNLKPICSKCNQSKKP